MQIEGKLIKILDPQKGKSQKGEWKKQDVIIETKDKFPKKVCVSVWNDKIDISTIKPGDDISFDINIESREYNGRWYTDIKAWKISSSQKSNNVPPPPVPEDIPEEPNDPIAFDENDGDMPF